MSLYSLVQSPRKRKPTRAMAFYDDDDDADMPSVADSAPQTAEFSPYKEELFAAPAENDLVR